MSKAISKEEIKSIWRKIFDKASDTIKDAETFQKIISIGKPVYEFAIQNAEKVNQVIDKTKDCF